MRVAVAIRPKATSPADTAPMKIVARLVDSAIAAARAPCRVKCSVVTNATAPGGGVAPSAPVFAFWSLLVVSPAFRRRPGSNYRSGRGEPGPAKASHRARAASIPTLTREPAPKCGLPGQERRLGDLNPGRARTLTALAVRRHRP